MDLSLEQEFDLRCFKDSVCFLSREQSQELLVELYCEMMVRENAYKKIVAHEWGLEALFRD